MLMFGPVPASVCPRTQLSTSKTDTSGVELDWPSGGYRQATLFLFLRMVSMAISWVDLAFGGLLGRSPAVRSK